LFWSGFFIDGNLLIVFRECSRSTLLFNVWMFANISVYNQPPRSTQPGHPSVVVTVAVGESLGTKTVRPHDAQPSIYCLTVWAVVWLRTKAVFTPGHMLPDTSCIHLLPSTCILYWRQNFRPSVAGYKSTVTYRVAQKNGANGPSYLIANILKTPRPNCVEIGELLQNYMLSTVINFLFKNFIALWRHLAKTPLLSFIHTVKIDLSITQ